MASRRERNNLASKKSYEKSLERAHATDYEFAMIERHLVQTGGEAWHWSVVPEDHLFEAGYIHDFAKHRLMRLMNKKRVEEGENRLRDYGMDGLARLVLETGEVIYHGLQAKYYTSRSVTAEDIGSFFAKQISMTLANPLSRGYLYTTTRLQADLADEVAQPTYPIRHVLYPWKHTDRRIEHVTVVEDTVNECDLPLRDYQVEVLSGMVDGRNAICIPCRMGKTLLAGHWTARLRPKVVIAIAPLKVSVENLRDRLACFLPDHAPLLVDSDADGTTDEKEIEAFMEQRVEKGESVVVYSTFQSAEDVLARWEWEEDTVLLVDEAHNAMGREDLCEWVQGFRRCLAMSATFPEEVEEAMGIEHKVVVPFSKGIEGGYIVDYTLWLPSLTKHEDGSTSVEAEIPVGFEAYERSMVLKTLYHAVCMLRTGSRRTIVYLGSQAECDEYMAICRRVLEEYHGAVNVWMGKITSEITDSKERKAILAEFQGGEVGSFRILTSVRILDEAVDIPSCDSVFITRVGEQSSDIRFFQRAQRSGTLDPKNPMKRNNIFLWAEGWERCVGALSLLREADPEFHAKVRHASVGYERSETVGGRAERAVRERVEFTEWSRMACETLEERVRRKCEWLMEWVEQEQRTPPSALEWKGVRLGSFWTDVKSGKVHQGLYRTLLSQNPILRADYERIEQEREEKKGKDLKTPEEKARMLMEWVEQEGRVPPSSLEWKGVRLGQFWTSVKGGGSQELYQTSLSSSLLLRADYERAEQEREVKKEKGLKTPEEKARMLMEWVEQKGRVPPKNLEWRGIKIGGFWNDVKCGKVHQELYRGILSTCHILQTEYERIKQEREEKKEKGLKTPEEKARLLMEWVEQEERTPPSALEWKGVKLGQFWTSVKSGMNQELYQTLLSTNPILRADYERIEQEREEKKEKGLKTPEERARLLLEWVEQEERTPPSALEWKGVKLGQFWSNMKGGMNQERYRTLLSTHPILRADYERTEQEREEKKEKGLKTPEEKARMLLEWVEQEGQVPPYSLEWKGVRLGSFWIKVKSGRNQERYRTLLSTHPILRADYERVEQEREEKKGKGLKTPEERARMLLEWVEQEGRTPPQSLEWKEVKLGHFWNRMKNSQCQELYRTLLSTHPILRADYERTEQEREVKKEKGLRTPEEKARLLMEWVEQEGRTPPQSLEWKGVRLGPLWNSVKGGGSQELYQTLLITNPLLRQDYERLQLLKQKKNAT